MNANVAYKPTPSWALPLPVCELCGAVIARVICGCLLPVAYVDVDGHVYCPACDKQWRQLEAQVGRFVLTDAGRKLTDELLRK